MNLLEIIYYLFRPLLIVGVAWTLFPIIDKLALQLHLWTEERRDERLRRHFQKEKDKLKDMPDVGITGNDLFKGCEPVKDFSKVFRRP